MGRASPPPESLEPVCARPPAAAPSPSSSLLDLSLLSANKHMSTGAAFRSPLSYCLHKLRVTTESASS